MRLRLTLLAALAVAAGCSGSGLGAQVDPMIGTAYTGHTYPGATLPFGMVSPSPDTGLNDWPHCPGYHYDDTSILGFSQTHMSGTGAPDMCDVMLIPVTGEPLFEAGPADNPDAGYRSRFSHDSETARTGYYAVTLSDYAVRCEMTASLRSPFYRFTYPSGAQAGLLLDMLHGNDGGVRDCDVRLEGDRVIKGWRRSYGFIRDHVTYFWAELSEPVTGFTAYSDGAPLAPGQTAPVQSKLYVSFAAKRPVLLRMGVSTVSPEAARENLCAEIAGRSFEAVAREAARRWDEQLSCIRATFPDPAAERTFYTALYHSFLVPNLITDVDGSYRGWDRAVHQSDEGDYYTNYSLWDTYRAVHPLLNLVDPARNEAFISSMLARYDQIGMLPINEYGTCETYCMIGYHSVPVIADAMLQGLTGFDYVKAWEAMAGMAEGTSRERSADPHYVPADRAPAQEVYKRYGYVPADREPNSVSETLEYAYDDWCLAEVARLLGKTEDADYYGRRARSFEQVFDPSVGFMRGRLSDGSWRTPFDPAQTAAHDQDFVEGNAWQYTFYVPHDVPRMAELYGGPEAFAAKLDEMFSTEIDPATLAVPDVTGLIGQYAHGNEPSHHVAYLYNYAGQPWKTQELVSRIRREMYSDRPDGLCGNDDCGQMSAWYVFSALGFYPVAPGSGRYDLGSPCVRTADLCLPGGPVFRIRTRTASGAPIGPSDIYVQSVRLNGAPYDKSYITLEDIRAGGLLEFTMAPQP